MTTATSTAPFPLPGTPVGNRNNMDALPVGSVVTQSDDACWAKYADNTWREREGGHANYPGEFDFNDGFTVQSIPALTEAAMHALPVESRIYWVPTDGPREQGLYNKTVHGRGVGSDYWVPQAGSLTTRNCLIASMGSVYLVHDATEAVEDTADDPLMVDWQAVAPGMYVQLSPTSKFLILKVEGDRWDGINISDAGPCRGQHTASGQYPVVAHDEALFNALAELAVEKPEVDVESRIEQARVEGRREVEVRWIRNMERLNERAHQYAQSNSLCNEFDNFMSEFTDIGLSPREQDYYVDIQVEGFVRMHVTASSEDNAREQAMDRLGISEGNDYRLNGEEFQVRTVCAEDSGTDD